MCVNTELHPSPPQVREEAGALRHDGSSDRGRHGSDLFSKLGNLHLHFLPGGSRWILQLRHRVCAGCVVHEVITTRL